MGRRESDKALEDAHALDATRIEHGAGPALGIGSDRR